MYWLVINILALIYLVTCRPQDTYILSGNISFPKNGKDYSKKISSDSCIHITVQEDIYCGEWGECRPMISGHHIIKNVKVVDNNIAFQFEAKKLESGMYNLGAILNMECSVNGEFQIGDYLNEYSNTFRLAPEENFMKRDIEIINPHEENDYFQNNNNTTTQSTHTKKFSLKSVLENTNPSIKTSTIISNTPLTTTNASSAPSTAPTSSPSTVQSTASSNEPQSTPARNTQTRTTKSKLNLLPTQSNEEEGVITIDTFEISGSIILPSTDHDYTNIPPTSCIHIHVHEDIYCHGNIECNPETSGHYVLKDFQVIDNRIEYSFVAEKLKSGLYNIGAIMNIKECTSENGHYNKGDYLSMTSYPFQLEADDPMIQDIEISCPKGEKDYFYRNPAMKHVVQGFMMLPKNGDYGSLPNEGCMQLHLYPADFVCKIGHCPNHILLSTFMPLAKVDEYRIEYTMNIFTLPKGKYMIRAIIHIGWCEKELSKNNWIHEADYFTKEVQHIDLNEADESNTLRKDLKLAPHKKYHCGLEKCCMNEKCVTSKETHTKHCIKDSHGRWNHKQHHGHHHHAKKVGDFNSKDLKIVAIAIFVIAAILLIVLVVFFCCKRSKAKAKSSFWYSKFQNMRTSSLKFPVPAENETPNNFYVSEPVRCMGAKPDREIKKDPVYLEKVDYVQFDQNNEENNTN